VFGEQIGLALPRSSRPAKVSLFKALQPHEKATLVELNGPGCIRCFNVVMSRRENQGRNMMLRLFWDGEERPSVESPLSDFFGVCHGMLYYPINSAFFSVKHQTGYCCYLPMPFDRSARIEMEVGPMGGSVYLYVDWDRFDEPVSEVMRFHAKWRREFPAPSFGDEYTILDAVGRGRLMGFTYGVRQYDIGERWSHGGGDELYIDGDTEHPSFIHGSGGEDTFGTGYGGVLHNAETHLFSGIPFFGYEDRGLPHPFIALGAYRLYANENYVFNTSLHFRFGCVGNDICSTAYWYQTEPHREFFRMPPWEKMLPGVELKRAECDLPPDHPGRWWLCGAFPLNAMQQTLPAETTVEPARIYDVVWEQGAAWTKDVVPDHPQTKARWTLCDDIHGFVDFSHAFRPRAKGVWRTWDGVACAVTWLAVSDDTDAMLTFTWDDELAYKLNDGPTLDLGDHDHFDSVTVAVRLKRGWNRLCVKQSNTFGKNWGGWCFAFLARLPDGTVLTPDVIQT
jgi:hypothetical protein